MATTLRGMLAANTRKIMAEMTAHRAATWQPKPGEKRYYVQAYCPGGRGKVRRYTVMDDKMGLAVGRFDVKDHGPDVALHLANTLRDDMNAGRCDCQNPSPEGVAHISEGCPVHNERPDPDCRA